MSIILEREVVVVSDDSEVQREVSAVVARHPGAHAVLGGPDGLRRAGSRRDTRIVVLDDTARRDALELLRDVKREPGEAAVVYLASDHSTALEGAVRRAGASFYCIKAARDGQLARVIDALLGQRD